MNTLFCSTTLAFFLAIATSSQTQSPDAADLAATIDRVTAERWKAADVVPARPTSDSEFLRRIYLDLVGRIPTVAESREFLANAAHDKRGVLIRTLLKSSASSSHMATFWSRTWIPQLDSSQFAGLNDEFHAWLATQLYNNLPYDHIVRDLITVDLAQAPQARETLQRSAPRAFLAACEFKPELLSANIATAFLGINLGCAQCHNHPFKHWKRVQFWQTAAFFARRNGTSDSRMRSLQLAIPDSDIQVTPEFLTAPDLTWPEQCDSNTGRVVFAQWLVSPENPYFARNVVNRMWANFLGAGLVEPLDDLNELDPAGQAKLLDILANELIASNFDLRYLSEAITSSQVYQLASEGDSPPSVDGKNLFARMPVRGLTAEQLYDSIQVAAGLPFHRDDAPRTDIANARAKFLSAFHGSDPGTADRSIPQALALMNGAFTNQLTTTGQSCSTLQAVTEAPFLDTRDKIETLVLATLCRTPSSQELASLVNYVEQPPSVCGKHQALGDVFWALLNSSEFNTNH